MSDRSRRAKAGDFGVLTCGAVLLLFWIFGGLMLALGNR